MQLQAIRMYFARSACRETWVNLSVFTGKLQLTHVNCVWGLFTCGLLVKLPAFAGNFAGVSFTVHVIAFGYPHLHVLISELIQSESALKIHCFKTKKNSIEQP